MQGQGFSLGQARSVEPFGMQRWASAWKAVNMHFCARKNAERGGCAQAQTAGKAKFALQMLISGPVVSQIQIFFKKKKHEAK